MAHIPSTVGSESVDVVMSALPGRERMRFVALRSAEVQTHPPADVILTVDYARRGNWWGKNAGLRQARADWVAFLDDDDWWFTDHLERLFAAWEPGLDVVYSRPVLHWDDGRDPEEWPSIPFDPDRLRRDNYIPSGYIVRRELALDVGGFPPPNEHVPWSDWGFLLRLLDAGCWFHHLDRPTWVYHRHGANTVPLWADTPRTSNAVGNKGD